MLNLINILRHKINKCITLSNKGVFIAPGATQLVRILSCAHSHAKHLVSWFIAPT